MARYSDSDDDYKSKKKSKRRSRSRSSSVDSYSRRKHKKKKSKSKKSVRSRSNSSERSYRSSRSKTSRRSRSRSRDRRSRDRSRDRTRRSRSRSRDRYSRRPRSRSGSRSRYRRSRSGSLSRSKRSGSRSRRSRSRSKRSTSRSRTKRSRSEEKGSPDTGPRDPTSDIPGFSEMSASEQAEKRLQLAILAAARADEKIKKETTPGFSLTFDEQHRRAKAVEAIDDDDFTQAEFVSSREQKLNTAEDFGHDDAMFGTGPRPTVAKRELTESKHGDSILHPNFFVSVEDKMPRWIQKLTNMRKKKLEGELF